MSAAMTKEERERFGPIERDEAYDRTYIPLPGGFEVQTKGNGSTFRIVDSANKFRLPVCEQPYLFDILERMARASHDTIAQLQARCEAAEKDAARYRWLVDQVEQSTVSLDTNVATIRFSFSRRGLLDDAIAEAIDSALSPTDAGVTK